jgi:hypothetical protein
VQKLASAAKISFTKRALLQEQNKFLLKANNEINLRWSARLVALRKAKVMGYKDLEEARKKREMKEKAITVKGKCCRKRKSRAQDTKAGGNSLGTKDKVAQLSEVEVCKSRRSAVVGTSSEVMLG